MSREVGLDPQVNPEEIMSREVGLDPQVNPEEIMSREVELDPQVNPEEIMSREVELDPQVNSEEIMSREVELGCESWTSFASGCSSTAVLRTLSLWLCPAPQLKQQLRNTLVAAQWRGDTALTLPLFWRRSTVSPVFFGRYPWSSLHSLVPPPLPPPPPPSPSLISNLASVDVKQNGPGPYASFRVLISANLCHGRLYPTTGSKISATEGYTPLRAQKSLPQKVIPHYGLKNLCHRRLYPTTGSKISATEGYTPLRAQKWTGKIPHSERRFPETFFHWRRMP